MADVLYGTKDFGMDPALADNAPALRKALAVAASSGKRLTIPGGRYLLDSWDPAVALPNQIPVFVDIKGGSLNVECEGTLAFGPTTAGSGATAGSMVRIQSSVTSWASKAKWSEGQFDLTNLPKTTTGLGGLSFGPKLQHVEVDGVLFNHGFSDPAIDYVGTGGGDTSLFSKESEFISIKNCGFIGAPDCAIYLSGDNNYPTRTGRRAVVAENWFYRCVNTIAIKRYFRDLKFRDNFAWEGQNGVLFGLADGMSANNGNRATISGNTFLKMMGDPIAVFNSDFTVVTDNTILDYRCNISDPTISKSVSSGNFGAAVQLIDSSHCIANGNTVGFDEWTAASESNKEAVAFLLKSGSKYNVISHNTVKAAYREFVIVGPDSTNNILGPNACEAISAASILQSSQ